MQKKVWGAILALCLLLGMLMAMPAAAADVIEIGSADDLLKLMSGDSAYPLSGSYKLTADIDMTGKTGQKPIGTVVYNTTDKFNTSDSKPFTGTFDGDGHTIKNLAITGTDYVGLFGAVNGATIKNLTVTGTVSGTNYVGGIVGIDIGSVTIENCTNQCTVTATNFAGGIVGNLGIKDVTVSASVKNCENSGAVTVDGQYAGGIAGYAHGASNDKICISDCTNTAFVKSNIVTDAGETVDGQDIGGIAGIVWFGTVSGCENTGGVKGYKNIGGIVGRTNGGADVKYCYNTGSVEADKNNSNSSQAGGIIGGMANGSLSNCWNTGDVLVGNKYAGGIVGFTTTAVSSISYCYSDAKVYKGDSYTAAKNVNCGVCGFPAFKSFSNCFYGPNGTAEVRDDTGIKPYALDKFDSLNGDSAWYYTDSTTKAPMLKYFCEHAWDATDGECDNCGTVCDHEDATFTNVSTQYHKCSICGLATLEHSWANSQCTDCKTTCTNHDWNGGYVCTICTADRPAITLTVSNLCAVPGIEYATLTGKLDGADVKLDFSKIVVNKVGNDWIASDLTLTGADKGHYTLESTTVTLTDVSDDYIVTLTVFGGTASETQFYRGQSASVTVTADAPAPGMQFAGWSIDESTDLVGVGESTYTYSFYAAADRTIEAVYEDNSAGGPGEAEHPLLNNRILAIAVALNRNKQYTVTFKSVGARLYDVCTLKRGQTVAAPEAPVKPGYTFVGWCSDINGYKLFDFNTAITKPTTLYAKWVKN